MYGVSKATCICFGRYPLPHRLLNLKIIARSQVKKRLMAALLAVFAIAAIASEPDCTQAQRIVQAVRSVQVDGNLAAVSNVALPDRLANGLLTDKAHLSYELALGPCLRDGTALHIFRAGAPYVVTTPNGQQLMSLTEAEHIGAQYNGRVPALFAVPPGVQSVFVVFQTKPHLLLGLLNVLVGPTSVMLPIEAQAVAAVVGYGRYGAGVLLVIGVLGLVLWLQRRSQASLFWLAVGCLFWGLRGYIYFASDLPLPARWFELLNPLLVLCTTVCVWRLPVCGWCQSQRVAQRGFLPG